VGRIKALRCAKCGWESSSWTVFRCSSCDAVLEVLLDLGNLTDSNLSEIRGRKERTIWRWFEFFPVESRSSIVSLGEGYTPLVQSSRLGEKLGLPRLHLKNDALLPTGSLKDRSNSVGLSRAKELGFSTAAVISTGNAAASVAAYAAAGGLKSVVMVPEGTSSAKVLQAVAYGATVVVVQGSFDDDVARLYRDALKEFGWYDCLSSNPYRDEGKKSYAYEMVDQLDGEVPDWVIHPTAGGTGLYAMWKGYNELLQLGWIKKLPRLVAAQSAAAAPLVRSFERGLAEVEPVEAGDTIAESIQVGNPISVGWRALEALRASKGTAVALSEDEIIEAQSNVARYAGIFAEPAGSISIAAARRLREQGVIQKDDLVVCNITGHGLKQPSAIRVADEELRSIPPILESLRERIQRRETKTRP
jgi:threonine synthase